MLIPTGIRAAEKPCSERPVSNTTKLPALSAATSDPTVINAMQTSIINRLPWLSANLATTGVATAEVTRVAVTSQDTLSVEMCISSWKPGSSGITMVCCKETVVPARQSTATTRQTGVCFGALRSGIDVLCFVQRGSPSLDNTDAAVGGRLVGPPGSGSSAHHAVVDELSIRDLEPPEGPQFSAINMSLRYVYYAILRISAADVLRSQSAVWDAEIGYALMSPSCFWELSAPRISDIRRAGESGRPAEAGASWGRCRAGPLPAAVGTDLRCAGRRRRHRRAAIRLPPRGRCILPRGRARIDGVGFDVLLGRGPDRSRVGFPCRRQGRPQPRGECPGAAVRQAIPHR